MENIPNKPEGFEDYLSEYQAIIYDSICGEIVGWGFYKVKNMEKEKWDELSKHGRIEYVGREYALIVKDLTRAEAIKKYGEITNEEFGPRGGKKSVTFGKTKFISDYILYK